HPTGRPATGPTGFPPLPRQLLPRRDRSPRVDQETVNEARNGAEDHPEVEIREELTLTQADERTATDHGHDDSVDCSRTSPRFIVLRGFLQTREVRESQSSLCFLRSSLVVLFGRVGGQDFFGDGLLQLRPGVWRGCRGDRRRGLPASRAARRRLLWGGDRGP